MVNVGKYTGALDPMGTSWPTESFFHYPIQLQNQINPNECKAVS